MKHLICAKPALYTFLVCAVAPLLAWQAPRPQSFSADFSRTGGSAEQSRAGKIYLAYPKVRVDTTAGARQLIIIADQSTQTSDVLVPQQHIYMELHGTQENPMLRGAKTATSFDPDHPCGSAAACSKAGTETVNGRVCDKWINTDPKGTSTVWIDQTLHFPIKTQSINGTMWQLTNIKEGPPDASLFEVPADYHKMDIPGMAGAGRPPE